MKGFSVGVIIVQNTATASSVDKVAVGLIYTNMPGTKNKMTTVMWETRVEMALCLSSKLRVLRQRRMTTEEAIKVEEV